MNKPLPTLKKTIYYKRIKKQMITQGGSSGRKKAYFILPKIRF